MKLGKLDRLIELFAPGAPVDDGYTITPGSMTSQGTRKARYIPAMPREVFENAGREAKMPVVFEVHSDTLTRTMDATWELEYSGTRYTINGVQEIGRQRGLRIDAVAGDNG